ncbi:dihydrodipicolinate synthase family protein [Lentzea chajnantorensis]
MAYSGTIVPLVTPLDDSGQVDTDSVARLVESVRGNVNGLMPTLSSGEGWLLDTRQWTDMVSATVEHSGGLPVLAGVQLPDTESVVERSRLAERLGVSAVVVTTPFRADISQDEIFQHYREVSEALDVGLFLYNEKAVSGNSIEPATLRRVCTQLPNVVGVKESSGSAELTRALVAECPGLPVFEGWENLLLEAQGVAGFIGPLANLEPKVCTEMLAEPTQERQDEINALCEKYGVFEDDWYRHVKTALRERGIIKTDRVVGT